jgi:hypothetical protein
MSQIGVNENSIIISLIFAILTVPLLISNTSIFEPIIFANVSLIVIFAIRPFIDLIFQKFVISGIDFSNTFTTSLLYGLIGCVALQIGYYIRVFPRKKKPCNIYLREDLKDSTLRMVAFFFTFFACALYFLFLQRNEFNCSGFSNITCTIISILGGRSDVQNNFYLNSSAYLYNAPLMLAPSALIFFSLAIKKLRILSVDFIMFLCISFFILIFFSTQGNRSHLLPFVSSLFFYYYFFSNKKPKIPLIALLIYLFFSLSSFLLDIRNSSESVNLASAFFDSMIYPLKSITGIMLGNDTEMFDAFAASVTIIPKFLDFSPASSLYDVILRSIPRIFFLDKPLETNDLIVSNLWPEHFSVNRASPASSFVGSLYADFGIYTIIIGMFLLGKILSEIWFKFSSSNSVYSKLFYSLVPSFIVILIRGTLPDTLGRALFYFLPFFILFFFRKNQMSSLFNYKSMPK